MRRTMPLALAVALLATAYGSARLAVDAADWLPGDTFVSMSVGDSFGVVAPDGTLKEVVDITERVAAADSSVNNACSGSDVRAIALNTATIVAGSTLPTLWVTCAGGPNPRLVIFDASPTSEHKVVRIFPVAFAPATPYLDLAVADGKTYALSKPTSDTTSTRVTVFRTTSGADASLLLPAPQAGRLAVGPDGALYTTNDAPLAAPGPLITRWTLPSLRSRAFPSALSDDEGALPANTSLAQGVRVMQTTLTGMPFGANFPAGAFARHMETTTDGQQLLLTGNNLHDGSDIQQCVVAQPIDGSDKTTLSCALGSNLWSVATGLPGQPGFVANTASGNLFFFAGLGSSAVAAWATGNAATSQTGLEVYGFWPLEPVCPESNFIGPSGSGTWWGPYRPDLRGNVNPSLSPVSWIDGCAKEVELCQAEQTTSDAPAAACVCQAWSCLNPPLGEAPITLPVCKSALPALRRFYCVLASAVGCNAFPSLPPLPASCDSLQASGFRHKHSRRSLQATS